jgi:hypothetical protein
MRKLPGCCAVWVSRTENPGWAQIISGKRKLVDLLVQRKSTALW